MQEHNFCLIAYNTYNSIHKFNGFFMMQIGIAICNGKSRTKPETNMYHCEI